MGVPIGPGTILAGKYRIGAKLGEGGMGVVFAATHLTLEKPRAIKLLRLEIATNPEAAQRFLREARAASELESRHVARVHDVDRLPSGEPYLVMEYLDGADLASVLAAHGALPAAEAALYVRQACDALAEAHARGLVHRDVKPANLFLARREGGPPSIKVLDFGIAKAAEPTPGATTAAGAFLGTLRYCAPEQIECSASVDARADLWALGVVLYELVTGVLPFDSPSTARLIALVTESSPALPSERVEGLPAGFDEIILHCLEKDRERRFASASELAEALHRLLPERDAPTVDRLSITIEPRASRDTVTAPPLPTPTPHLTPPPSSTPLPPPTPLVAALGPGRSLVAWGVAAMVVVTVVIAALPRATWRGVAPIATEPLAVVLTASPVSSAAEPLPSARVPAPSAAPPELSATLGPGKPAAPPALPASATAAPQSRLRPGGTSVAKVKPDVPQTPPPQGPSDSAIVVRPPRKPGDKAMKYDIEGNVVSE